METHHIEESNLVKKLDMRLIPYLSLLYLMCFLDRVNIGYAKLYDLEADLKLSQFEYSWCLSIFFVGYVLFEVPSNLLLKRMSAPVWISRIMITWGILTICLAFTNNFLSLFITRLFLGVSEAGLFPGIIFYLSFWYTKKEQGLRTSFFFSASSLAGAFGSLIAYGISFMDGIGNLKSWQWIFILEGTPSVLLGIVTYFYLPAIPDNAKWLNQEEQKFLVQRLEKQKVITSETRFNKKQFIDAFIDFKVHLFMLMFFGLLTPLYSMALLLPTIIKDFGFSTTTTFLMSAPPYAVSLIFAICVGYNSDRVLERSKHLILGATVSLVGFILLFFLTDTAGRYFGCFLVVMGYTSAIPLTTSWLTNNVIGTTKAGTATALVVSFGNIGGVVAGQLYTKKDAPLFHMSHGINIGMVSLTIVCAIIQRYLLTRENKKLDAQNEKELEDNGEKFRYTL